MTRPQDHFSARHGWAAIYWRKGVRNEKGRAVHGTYCPSTGEIEIDLSQTERNQAATLLHEILHDAAPWLTEQQIGKLEVALCRKWESNAAAFAWIHGILTAMHRSRTT